MDIIWVLHYCSVAETIVGGYMVKVISFVAYKIGNVHKIKFSRELIQADIALVLYHIPI